MLSKALISESFRRGLSAAPRWTLYLTAVLSVSYLAGYYTCPAPFRALVVQAMSKRQDLAAAGSVQFAPLPPKVREANLVPVTPSRLRLNPTAILREHETLGRSTLGDQTHRGPK